MGEMNGRARLPLVNDYVAEWAQRAPDRPAMIQHETGRQLTYAEFAREVDLFALRLLQMGIRKGDRVATMLLLLPEHLVLMYSCFKIGAIAVPLDVRLKEAEVVQALGEIKPRLFVFPGRMPVRDFRQVGRAVQEQCPYVEQLIQLSSPEDELLKGAVDFADLFSEDRLEELGSDVALADQQAQRSTELGTRTPLLIISTTGTTGAPKPAVLCHENVIVQNEVLARGLGLAGADLRFVCNLPASHVAGTSEAPMTTFYAGGTAILLGIFDARATLRAVERWRATALGMIPTQYRMVWNVPDYDDHDLSSLRAVIYAGAAGDRPFLQRLAGMAPHFATGLGMTENAGFATVTPPGIPVEEMVGQVGRAFDDLAQVSVRKPLQADGTAGAEVADGELGEICYHPPIVFLGYFGQPQETARVVSKEGILYTGDMGFFEDMGSYRALRLAGRRKFIIKQKGYNVFPDEVADHIARLPQVAVAEVVGAPHDLFDEGVFAFVQSRPGTTLTVAEVQRHCQGIASYKRPQHIALWPEGEPWPLTRSGKVDRIALQERALTIVATLREHGGWDR